jgi:1,4-alpha-glucan branching enzyme
MDHIEKVSADEGGIQEFTQGYKYFGMHFNPDNSVTCREWAPGAANLFLAGDFSELLAFRFGLDS